MTRRCEMPEVRLNLYQADREFQIEIGSGGFVFGYRLLGPKFDGSSRLIKSVILSDRDKEEIVGYVNPDAKAVEEERDGLKVENAALKFYRTAEGRRRSELYAAKVDANWCLKKENEALRKELATWKAAWATEDGAVKKLEGELADLRAWKESALLVESEWDVQAVGREIGVDLGESIRPQILPYIKRLKATLKNIR
jgi:hypothetical protein